MRGALRADLVLALSAARSALPARFSWQTVASPREILPPSRAPERASLLDPDLHVPVVDLRASLGDLSLLCVGDDEFEIFALFWAPDEGYTFLNSGLRWRAEDGRLCPAGAARLQLLCRGCLPLEGRLSSHFLVRFRLRQARDPGYEPLRRWLAAWPPRRRTAAPRRA
jgi:hypothetical protein